MFISSKNGIVLIDSLNNQVIWINKLKKKTVLISNFVHSRGRTISLDPTRKNLVLLKQFSSFYIYPDMDVAKRVEIRLDKRIKGFKVISQQRILTFELKGLVSCISYPGGDLLASIKLDNLKLRYPKEAPQNLTVEELLVSEYPKVSVNYQSLCASQDGSSVFLTTLDSWNRHHSLISLSLNTEDGKFELLDENSEFTEVTENIQALGCLLSSSNQIAVYGITFDTPFSMIRYTVHKQSLKIEGAHKEIGFMKSYSHEFVELGDSLWIIDHEGSVKKICLN